MADEIDLTDDQSRRLDAAWDELGPEYVAGWNARRDGKPKDRKASPDWRRGWDDCDAELK